jgi:hypothetical protein
MEEASSEAAVAAEPGAAKSSAAAGFAARARAWVEGLDGVELGVIAAVLALCLLVRLLRLQPVEYYEDEVSRWHFVRQWFYDNDFRHAPWTHQMARFGINVPLFFVLAALGRHASVYYVWPVASFALQVLFTYLTIRRLGGRGAAVLGAVLLSVFTGMDRGACQLMPDGFGATGMILVMYLLVRFQDTDARRPLRWLIGAALAFVWTYEIKESNLLFLPGLCLGVWLARGRFRDGVIFGAVVVGAIVVETAGFRLFTDYSSRFAIVQEAHGIATVKSFWNLFDRYTRLELPWQMLIYTWVIAVFWLLASRDRRLHVLVLVPTLFMLLLTFMVRGTDPIVLWTRFFSRYFEPAAPLFVVAVALFVADLSRRIWAAHAPPRLDALRGKLSRQPVLVTLVVCALVALAEKGISGATIPNESLRDTRRISGIVNDAYKRNLPIVQSSMRKEIQERRVRSLKALYGIYLKDEVIASSPLSKPGELPNVLDAIQESKRYSYVVYDPKAYTRAQLEEWVDRGCAIVVTEKKGYLNAANKVPSIVLQQESKLPAHCAPPAARTDS